MRVPHRCSRHLDDALCLFLIYAICLSLFAPLTIRQVQAAPVASGSATPIAAFEQPQHKANRREGELIVRFRQGVTEQEKNGVSKFAGASRMKRLRGGSRLEKLQLQAGQTPEAVAAELRGNPAVELAEPNYLISRDELIPNDARFNEQWALRNTGSTGGLPNADISAAMAWETTTGAQATVIAVIDSGIDFTHPDLVNNQWTNNLETANNRDDDRNGLTDDVHGWDWVADTGDVRDEQGHGTLVAGIIAAEGNNATGISGVMWRASLMSLRVLDSTGTGDIASAVEAIDYATAHGAQVINCSWGTDQESIALKDAIQRAGTRGVVVVSSAGNSGLDIESTPYYPASFGLSNQIAVASTDNFDRLASWSNYGATHITIAAPGTDILTTKMSGGYMTVTGTSASAPLVAGVAGLIKTQRWWLTAAGTRAAIVDGARPVAELTGKVSSGGVVNAAGAITALQQAEPEPTPTPAPDNGGNNPPTEQEPGSDVPDSNLPDLDTARNTEPSDPVAPVPISADEICLDCEQSCLDCEPPPAPGNDPYFATARTRPENETGRQGVNLGSRNFNWSLPLVSLPGRSGLDLNIGISYNSLVWTKQGNAIMFNADRGNPSPGFRLGLPTLEAEYVNADAIASSYLLVMPSGGRVELRQVGTSTIYESHDGSYMQAVDNSGAGTNITVRATDGTQYLFTYSAAAYGLYCTQVKDRNGNYITINYANGKVSNFVDTLGRTITFNYNAANQLISITQTWNGAIHTWATFGYNNIPISTNFPGLTYSGPSGSISMLTQIGLGDGTRYNFDYTSWGQIYKISNYAQDGHLLSYTSYNLPLNNTTTHSDCPRFTQRSNWAENWNGGVAVVTNYSVDPNSTSGGQPAWSQMTMPDGTVYKELFATSGWQKGLTTGTEVWVGAVKKKWTTTIWTQDDATLTYQKNPRPVETNIYDEAGNRRRTTFTYLPTTSFNLPSDVYEYAANGTTVLRRSHTDYNLTTAYTSRRIIGLPSMKVVYDGANKVFSKVEYQYDEGGTFFVNQGTLTNHDATNYGATFISGRGNLTSVRRWDGEFPTDAAKMVESNIGYNNAGSVVLTRDPLGHQASISYTDAFFDTTKNSLNTLAFPTKVMDPDAFYATTEYNYDTGAVTRVSRPSSGTGAGVTYEDLTFTYDTAGRPSRVTNLENNTYTRWVYPTSNTLVQQYQTINSTAEAYSAQLLDGAGRVRAAASDHPGSMGLYSGQYFIYDTMGRLWKQSNPTEMTATWAATGDDAANGWKYTLQTYDWQGRPLVTTNTDATTREMTYGGCGCAGGEQVTTKDERGRQKRLTKDVLGRLSKIEELNFDGTLYATTTYTYDTLDQLTQTNQSGQLRTFDYDGHGRLISRTTPEQGTATYTYNADSTMQKMTDARGASATYAYNNRHLPTSITYGVTAGVAATPNVTFAYDAAGNRTQMTDGLGTATYHYDALSRMDWEQRSFTGLTGTYKLSYAYNLAGELTSVTGPSQFGSVQVGYSYDKTGRTTAVTGSGYAGVSSYINTLQYRAFGGVKQVTYGNSRNLSINYDTRLRMTRWDVAGVLGSDYEYRWEDTFRPTMARSRTDATLDRWYNYDQVGRLHIARSGSEARAAYGEAWNGQYDGPYSMNLHYDVWGNLTLKEGWGAQNAAYTASYTNNRRNGSVYDAAGNITSDGGQTFTYDATGQQTYASATGLTQSYDGDRVRIKRVESGATTYYLRSSVLGRQVISEINSTGQMLRGYVYLGGQMLAVQEGGQVSWVHQDPVTKSQRLTDSTGAVVSTIELDPWGGEIARSSNQAKQPHRYTTYERDANGGDEAMMRRYESKWSRFAQPDPYNGSYNLSNPQSFNRYAYVQNEPVNFTDPSGLEPNCEDSDGIIRVCTWDSDLGGGGGGGGVAGRQPELGPVGEGEVPQNPRQTDKERTDDCWSFANSLQGIANGASSIGNFLDTLASTFTEYASRTEFITGTSRTEPPTSYSDSGFQTPFLGSSSSNQVRHYVGALIAAYWAGGVGRWGMDRRERNSGRDGGPDKADIALNAVAAQHAGAYINPLFSTIGNVRRELAAAIRRDLCTNKPQQ